MRQRLRWPLLMSGREWVIIPQVKPDLQESAAALLTLPPTS